MRARCTDLIDGGREEKKGIIKKQHGYRRGEGAPRLLAIWRVRWRRGSRAERMFPWLLFVTFLPASISRAGGRVAHEGGRGATDRGAPPSFHIVGRRITAARHQRRYNRQRSVRGPAEPVRPPPPPLAGGNQVHGTAFKWVLPLVTIWTVGDESMIATMSSISSPFDQIIFRKKVPNKGAEEHNNFILCIQQIEVPTTTTYMHDKQQEKKQKNNDYDRLEDEDQDMFSPKRWMYTTLLLPP